MATATATKPQPQYGPDTWPEFKAMPCKGNFSAPLFEQYVGHIRALEPWQREALRRIEGMYRMSQMITSDIYREVQLEMFATHEQYEWISKVAFQDYYIKGDTLSYIATYDEEGREVSFMLGVIDYDAEFINYVKWSYIPF